MKKSLRIIGAFVLMLVISVLVGYGWSWLRINGFISKDLSMILSLLSGIVIGTVISQLMIIPALES